LHPFFHADTENSPLLDADGDVLMEGVEAVLKAGPDPRERVVTSGESQRKGISHSRVFEPKRSEDGSLDATN
jgi:hypothetical protein